MKGSWALVAHACNPSYSGGRDEEDLGSKPARASSLKTLSQKYPTKNRAGRVAQAAQLLSKHEVLSSNPSTGGEKRFDGEINAALKTTFFSSCNWELSK
jgi:hypothetical protein